MECKSEIASIRVCFNNKCYNIIDIHIQRFFDFLKESFGGYKGGSTEENPGNLEVPDSSTLNENNTCEQNDNKYNFEDFKKVLDSLKAGGYVDSDGDFTMDRFLATLNKNILSKSLNNPDNQNNKTNVKENIKIDDNPEYQESGGRRRRRKKRVYGNDITSDELDTYQFTESKLLELAE